MKMNKTLLAILAMSSVAGVAQAQVNLVNTDSSTLSLYGILDAGIVQMTHAGDISALFGPGAVPTGSPAKIGTVRGMMNGGESASRWGIMGSEDMGDGNKAFFKLESGINVPSGNVTTSGVGVGGVSNRAMTSDSAVQGQLFGRAAYVGLSNTDLGAISLGRMNSLQLDIITAIAGGYDPVGAQMFSPLNFSGSYGGGGKTDDSRVDQAVKYSKQIGSVNVNALYGFGGVAGASTARSNVQLNVGYEAGSFGVQGAAQRAKDTTKVSAGTTAVQNSTTVLSLPGSVNVQFVDTTSYMLAGRWQVMAPLTLKAGYEREEFKAPSNPTTDMLTTTIYGYSIATPSVFTGAQQNVNVYWLGANYDVSAKTKLSVGYYDAEALAYGTTASSADKYASVMVEYNLSKKTNVYAAFMQDKKSGSTVAAAGSITTFNTVGAGLRVKF